MEMDILKPNIKTSVCRMNLKPVWLIDFEADRQGKEKTE